MTYRDLGDRDVITHDDATETVIPKYTGTLPTEAGGGASAANRAAMVALAGSAGDTVTQVPEVASDDDGGHFRYEASTPASATITGVTSVTKTITGATNAAPIVITTSATHGLSTGHSVKITSVGGNTNANGSWLVKVLTTTTFELVDSKGNDAYTTGGSATYAIVATSAAHGYLAGSRVTIAGVGGATAVNGTWWPVGLVGSTSFTIPAPAASVYTTGGIIGDGGVSVPKTDGTGRWMRLLDASDRFNARWFGALGDGVTDDTAAAAACVFAAIAARRTSYFPAGTYLVEREFNLVTQGARIRGDGQVVGAPSASRTVLKCTRLGQRSVFSISHSDADIADMSFDCDLKANYGLYFQTGSQSKFQNLLVYKAILDGYHLTAVRDDAGAANNDMMSFVECSAYLCGQVFHVASLAGVYAGGPNIHPTTATGTVETSAYTQTITGTGTNFLAAGARPGDFICIGTGSSRITLEIQTVVDNDTITVYATSVPEVTISGEPYAIGVGDGFHAAQGNDNNTPLITSGLWRGNGGSGIVCRGLYGPIITKTQCDTNGVYGVVIGTAGSGSGTFTSVLSLTYYEAAGGEIGAICAQNAPGLTIDQPLWGGAADSEQIIVNQQNFAGVGAARDPVGSRQWGGIHNHRDIYYESWDTAAFWFLGGGRSSGDFTVFASSSPVNAKQIPIPSVDHSGCIDVDVQTTYNASGVKRCRHKFTYGYILSSGSFTLGTVNTETPSNQTNANVPQPTVTMVTVGSEKRINLAVSGHSDGTTGGATHHTGRITVTTAGKP